MKGNPKVSSLATHKPFTRKKPFQRFERTGSCRRFCGMQCCGLAGFQGTPEYEQIKKEFLEPPFFGLNARGECNKLIYKHGIPTCSTYETRPEICRTFPLHPRDLAKIPECGYSFIRQPDPIVPRPAPNPFYAIQDLEEWPLFTLQRHTFMNPASVWVGLYSTAPVKTVEAMRLMMLELRRLEWKCWHGGLGGWLVYIPNEKLTLQGAVVAMQAEPYHETASVRFFKRPIDRKPAKTIPTVAEAKASVEAYLKTMRYAHAGT